MTNVVVVTLVRAWASPPKDITPVLPLTHLSNHERWRWMACSSGPVSSVFPFGVGNIVKVPL